MRRKETACEKVPEVAKCEQERVVWLQSHAWLKVRVEKVSEKQNYLARALWAMSEDLVAQYGVTSSCPHPLLVLTLGGKGVSLKFLFFPPWVLHLLPLHLCSPGQRWEPGSWTGETPFCIPIPTPQPHQEEVKGTGEHVCLRVRKEC